MGNQFREHVIYVFWGSGLQIQVNVMKFAQVYDINDEYCETLLQFYHLLVYLL